jgi:ABC-type polysaccharide/polyol phosphate export permease
MTTLPVYDSAQPRRPLLTEFRSLWSHRGLIRLLVARDLTVRYKRSVLGVWWTLLNPLLTTGIMWVVFGELFGGRFGTTEGEPYLLYLLAGILLMTFFSQAILATGAAITGASSILSKVYVPAEVFAFAASVAGAANFVISLVPLLLIQVFTGHGIPWTALLVPIPTLAMLALVTGLGMLVAAAATFFYDVLDLTRVGVQLLSYLTPVFWPLAIVPDRFLSFVKANPLFSYFDVFRAYMYRGEMVPAWELAVVSATALAALALGVWAFSRAWRNLVSRI